MGLWLSPPLFAGPEGLLSLAPAPGSLLGDQNPDLKGSAHPLFEASRLREEYVQGRPQGCVYKLTQGVYVWLKPLPDREHLLQNQLLPWCGRHTLNKPWRVVGASVEGAVGGQLVVAAASGLRARVLQGCN